LSEPGRDVRVIRGAVSCGCHDSVRPAREVSMSEEGDAGPVAIELENLCKTFPGGVRAVDGLSLKIKRGELFGFLGPNGAGKTTSIRMMVGLLKPTSGRVTVEGRPIEKAPRELRAKIGVCPQEIVVWNLLTCKENLTLIGAMYDLPAGEAKKRADALLAAMQLTDKADALANTLSGGMKRRLNVAMALVHDPDIVVLDEPTAGLDPQSRLVVTEYIDGLRKGKEKTIILTTHMMDIADQFSDRVAIIDHGKLLQLDTPENLKDRIGKGDVLEIALLDPSESETAIAALKKVEGISEAVRIEQKVEVRALDVAGKIPQILRVLDEAGARVSDLSLRRNTLEDVFITLTGRRLRE